MYRKKMQRPENVLWQKLASAGDAQTWNEMESLDKRGKKIATQWTNSEQKMAERIWRKKKQALIPNSLESVTVPSPMMRFERIFHTFS